MTQSPPPLPNARNTGPRKRRRSAVTIVLIVLVGGLVLTMAVAFVAGVVAGFTKEREKMKAVDEMYADIEALRAQVLDQYESDEIPKTVHSINTAIATMERTAATFDPDEREMMTAAIGVLADLLDEASEYDNALAAVNEAGGIDPATIGDAADIDERLVLFDRAKAATQALYDAYGQVQSEMLRRAEATSSDGSAFEGFKRGLTKGGDNYQRAAKIIQLDLDMIVVMSRMLKMLRDRRAYWTYDPPSEMIEFDDDADIDRYNAMYDELNDLIAQQERLVRLHLTSPMGR